VDARRTVSLRACVLLTTVAALAVVLVPRRAGALSCASHPRGAPADILSGHPQLAGGSDFFRRFDRAVIGMVTGIAAVEEDGPAYADTTLTVDVAAVVGDAAAPPSSIQVSSPDPGWHSGHRFEVGTTYFIPLAAEGPDGRPNASFACDPISEVRSDEVDELRRLATEAGIAFSTPAPEDPDRGVVIAVAAAVVALVGAVVLARRLTRGRSTGLPTTTPADA
jgi:hypothetical protein